MQIGHKSDIVGMTSHSVSPQMDWFLDMYLQASDGEYLLSGEQKKALVSMKCSPHV